MWKQSDQLTIGPPVRVVATNVDARPLPSDGVLEIAFDRPLLPITVVRQSLVLRDGSGAPLDPPNYWGDTAKSKYKAPP